MNIVLIYPFFTIDRVHIENIEAPPIGLHYLGALLKELGHEVVLLNWFDAKDKPYLVQEALNVLQPDVIGFSIFHANRWGGIQLAKIFKDHFPEVPIVFGGIGATFLDEHLLQNFPWIDIVVRGEGERTFPELLSRIKSCQPYNDLPGLTFREGDHIQRNCDVEQLENLDGLPNPAKYYTYNHLALSRGCPGNCTFCGSPKFWGSRVRFHSASYFVEQLELLYEKGQRFFYFSDDTFTLRKKLVLEICHLIIKKGLDISWAAISRVDCIDEEILGAMRMAGCIQISFGVESGSESIRKVLNKRFNDDQIQRAFALTTSYGILARAYIIYGCPGESQETITDTIRLLEEIQPLVTLFYVLAMFPGTYLYDLFKTSTGATDDVWLYQEEDMLFFEVDAHLTEDVVAAYGRALKEGLEQRIPFFLRSLNLVDDQDMYVSHAGFLSRLALTIDRGDYPHKLPEGMAQELARELYHKALEYAPVARSYWGLGLLAQAEKDYDGAEDILREGIKAFPDDDLLTKTLINTLVRQGREGEARQLMQSLH